MKYLDGQEVLLGDVVEAFGAEGVIVSVIDTDQYSPPEHSREQWEFLKVGAIIEAECFGGLLHLSEADEEFLLLRRKSD